MPKCDFNKVAKQLRTSVRVFSCKFTAYFQNFLSLRTPLEAASACCSGAKHFVLDRKNAMGYNKKC